MNQYQTTVRSTRCTGFPNKFHSNPITFGSERSERTWG